MDFGLEGIMKQADEKAKAHMEAMWDRCKICQKSLPPGTPVNKLYDDELGSITTCVDCSLKAILWYVRKLYGKDTKV